MKSASEFAEELKLDRANVVYPVEADAFRRCQADTLTHAASICRGVYGNSSPAEHAIAEECARRIEAEMGKAGL